MSSHTKQEDTQATQTVSACTFDFEGNVLMFPNNDTTGAHSEIGDGAGTVKGAFSYVDPRNQVRTVEYTADENGFHPQLSHPSYPNKNTKAVDLATQRHLELYNKIAERNSDPSYVQNAPVPQDTAAVCKLKRSCQTSLNH